MKIKLTADQIAKIAADPQAAEAAKIDIKDPWWVIVLKVLKYVIEIVLAGAGGSLLMSFTSAFGLH